MFATSLQIVFILCFSICSYGTYATGKPNIVFIVADDMGWNDVSFHGSNQILTSNIDALAYNGIIFNNHYTQSTCTPSRTALLTGKYPSRLGMQGLPLQPAQIEGLPEVKLLPQYLKELGYSTHLVGKWHLGYSRWNNTPTYRGFDHFLGYYTGFVSYYDYLNTLQTNKNDYSGFDLRRETEPAWDLAGKYATDVFTDHAVNTIHNHNTEQPLFLMLSHLAAHTGNEGKYLEAPQETINKFKHIPDSSRRTYAAMVSKLDDSVGSIVAALQEKNILNNTILIFLGDNGAPTKGKYANSGSNYPLKGQKDTLLEGGVRGIAFAWSTLFMKTGKVSTKLMHLTDWLPTLLSAAGGNISNTKIDGVDQWNSLKYNMPSLRKQVLINIDEIRQNEALRLKNWKLLIGTTSNGIYDKYLGESGTYNIEEQTYNTSSVYNSPVGQAIRKVNHKSVLETQYKGLRQQATVKCLNAEAKKNPCTPANGEVCLFDIPRDPCEENNLAKLLPNVVKRMKRILDDYKTGIKPQITIEIDIKRNNPELFQFTWNPWLDCSNATCEAF